MTTALATVPGAIATEEHGVLAKAAARGDAAAFADLYGRFSRPVYNMALRCLRNPQEAEDVCQEVWIRAHRELTKLRDPGAFPLWLYRIAARACVDAARKRSRVPSEEMLSDDPVESGQVDLESTIMQREMSRLVWEALGALPVRQHLALFLKEAEGRGYREIAEILGTSESAVETLLFRARRGLAKAYRRLETARRERCLRAHEVMAALVDGEATPVQRRALRAHADGCSSCHEEMEQVRRGSAAYAGLALLPAPALLGERVCSAVGAATSGAGVAGAAKFIALLGAKTKLLAVTLTVTGGLTAGLMASQGGQLDMGGEPAPQGPSPVPARASEAAGAVEPRASQGLEEYGQAELEVTLSDLAEGGVAIDDVGDVDAIVDDLAEIEPPLGETISAAEELTQPITGESRGLVEGASALVEDAQAGADGVRVDLRPARR